ncbi:MAG: winged helix-turn-helix domain-containing protein [Xanthobacteraceae bacterium]
MTGVVEAYVFGPFTLRVGRRELLAHGVPLTIGQRAFDILLTLVSRHGELVTKDDLMAAVWPGIIVEENNIQVHVSALRKVLSSAGAGERYLVTVAGRGYRFVAPVLRDADGSGQPTVTAPAQPSGGTSAAPPALSNLPQSATALIGRDHDLAEIKSRLSSHRLVTLSGAGGVGKTRLAIEAGKASLDRYAEGVWLAELAPLNDAQLVTSIIADAVGVSLGSQDSPIDALTAALKPKQILLIIDNCEHVITAAARVAEALIRSCPHVTILASSRVRLAIAGECVIRVPSLASPQSEGQMSASHARQFAAVELFTERASALGDGFQLNDENAALVGSICHRLDGIPLAIELAVPRLKVLPLAQLARGLDERFRLLTGGSRTALPRQQTLHATIDWSYSLLSEPEKLMLTRLSVFLGGSSLASIIAVVADAQLAAAEVSDLLLSLVEKSLVHADLSGSEPRYRLLESTRHYASEKLTESAALLRQHAAHFAARLAQASQEWETMPTTQWIAFYEADLDNTRAALKWAFGPSGDSTLGVELAGHSHLLWAELGLMLEHRRWIDQGLTCATPATKPELVARLLSWQAGEVRELDDPADYEEAMRAATLHHQARESFQEGRALLRAGMARLSPDSVEEGEQLLQKAHALVQGSGATKTLARCLGALASARLFAGDPSEARMLHEQAIEVYRKLGEVTASAAA